MAETVLFVDDESDLHFMVASYFEMQGFELLAAADAAEAMRLATGRTLCAIILDVNLPGEGSGALLEKLKQLHPGVPIILYTGREGDDETVKDLLAKGA